MINSNKSNMAEGIGFQPGELIGRYEVIARIAIGGQSIIYKCHDPALDRFVAVKQISTHLAEDKMFLDRFRTEAQILARLGAEQPEVVTIHDLLESKQGLFIVMEFVEGVSLERTLTENPGPVELKACLQILWRLCSALHTVHAAGVIHRDIKPSNVIIADGLRPMITDFGVAATSSGEASMVMGSTKYMAPELFTGGYVDGRADMYSLGFIAYEMLVGREKFNEIFADIVRDKTAEKVRWMKWHSNPKVSAPPPHEVNPAVPITMSNIVLRMIAKDSEQRFEGMEDLGRAIKLTFKPGGGGAKAQAAQTPVATPVDGEASPMAPGRLAQPSPFDTEEAVTAPIPGRQLSLGMKIGLGVAAVLVLTIGLIFMSMQGGQEVVDKAKLAAKAWKDARELYKSDRNYTGAEKAFLGVQKYEDTEYTKPSQVYVHMCRTQLAIRSKDWASAQTELDNAMTLRRKIQAASERDSRAYNWTVTIKESIRALDALRVNKKAFAEVMANAESLYASRQYDKALAELENEYEDPSELDADQQKILAAFKLKVARTQSLGECEKIMAAARQADQSDPSAALAAWEKALAGLQSQKPHVEQSAWKRMYDEVDKARTKLTKQAGLQEIMSLVANARNSGDPARLRRALEAAMAKPGVPPQLIKRWGDEIKEIEEKADFAAITTLMGSSRDIEAIDALKAFIKKYPNNGRAKVILGVLEAKVAWNKRAKDATDLFERGRYEEVLPELGKLRVQFRGDRKWKEMIRTAEFEIELVVFNAAEKAGDMVKATASSDRLRLIWVDKHESRIEPRLGIMGAKKKVRDTLAKGEKEVANGEYIQARRTVDHLKESYPEAAEIIRKSRYLGAVAKGDAATKEGDSTTALAMYKIAKRYAKGAVELGKVNNLIGALQQGN
jgi:tRNA A-37 threonylcarbamoyl transferase component Bud32